MQIASNNETKSERDARARLTSSGCQACSTSRPGQVLVPKQPPSKNATDFSKRSTIVTRAHRKPDGECRSFGSRANLVLVAERQVAEGDGSFGVAVLVAVDRKGLDRVAAHALPARRLARDRLLQALAHVAAPRLPLRRERRLQQLVRRAVFVTSRNDTKSVLR